VRFRDLVSLLLGLVIAAGVAYGVWTWVSEPSEPGATPTAEPPPDPAEITAREYLAAWAAGDHLDMRDLVRDPPDDFVARHLQLRNGLQVTDATMTPGPMTSDVDGRAAFPVTVALDVPYAAEPLTWETELNLIRDRGNWGVVWSLTTIHPELRESWEFGTERESVARKDILAADGTVLSGESTLVTFGFEPTAVQDVDAVVEAFADALPGSEGAAERELNRTNLVDGWFYPIVTVSEQQADEAAPRLREVSGVLRQTDGGRALYDDGFAQHVVGVYAEATAEQLEELGGGEPGLQIGQFGLERVFEDRLTGSDIVRAGLLERDQPGETPLRVVIAETQADPSSDVTTTLDIQVQQAIENALVGTSGEIGIVAVDASNGAILGAASRPLTSYNRAFAGRFPPGSTFKTVTAEALLASGLTPDDPTECPAETTIGGLRVPNAGDTGRGTIPFRAAFAFSCNTTFARLGADLGADELVAAAERFGFGVEPDLPLSAFGGSFPTPEDTAETGAAAFGQARVEASVLHMASVAAAATTGTWYRPYLLEEDAPTEQRDLSPGVTDALRDLMRAVVTDGTGTAAAVEGQEVFGKTGTAQATGDLEHAWFIGAADGVGFAIIVEDGGAGGQVAGPIAARFVQELADQRRIAAERAAEAGQGDGDGQDDQGEVEQGDGEQGDGEAADGDEADGSPAEDGEQPDGEGDTGG
jgi:cell division protein FtsI/penicillin-binding protein 2